MASTCAGCNSQKAGGGASCGLPECDCWGDPSRGFWLGVVGPTGEKDLANARNTVNPKVNHVGVMHMEAFALTLHNLNLFQQNRRLEPAARMITVETGRQGNFALAVRRSANRRQLRVCR
jgi:hypothetical protein